MIKTTCVYSLRVVDKLKKQGWTFKRWLEDGRALMEKEFPDLEKIMAGLKR